MSDPVRPGLRERKRLATRRTIQLAVLRLVAEHGLDRVTIDDITTAADVSPRTFFNYFASKEAAIVGDGPELPDDAQTDAFVNGGPDADIIAGLGDLITEATKHSSVDLDALRLRKELHQLYPQLTTLRMIGMRRFEDELVALVSRRLATDHPSFGTDVALLESRARLITFVALAAMRHAWMCWAEGSAATPLTDRMRQSFAELDSLRLAARPELVE